MNFYFDNIENQIKLKEILDSWKGTQFKHRCNVKQGGVDCLNFVAKVFEELGIIKWRKDLIPEYLPDWHMHDTREQLLEGLMKELNIIPINLNATPMNGDILTFFIGKAAAHVAIYFDRYLYQAIARYGVTKISANDQKWKNRLTHIFRIME